MSAGFSFFLSTLKIKHDYPGKWQNETKCEAKLHNKPIRKVNEFKMVFYKNYKMYIKLNRSDVQ